MISLSSQTNDQKADDGSSSKKSASTLSIVLLVLCPLLAISCVCFIVCCFYKGSRSSKNSKDKKQARVAVQQQLENDIAMPSLNSLPYIEKDEISEQQILHESIPINDDQEAQESASNSNSPDELIVHEKQDELQEPHNPQERQDASQNSRLKNLLENQD